MDGRFNQVKTITNSADRFKQQIGRFVGVAAQLALKTFGRKREVSKAAAALQLEPLRVEKTSAVTAIESINKSETIPESKVSKMVDFNTIDNLADLRGKKTGDILRGISAMPYKEAKAAYDRILKGMLISYAERGVPITAGTSLYDLISVFNEKLALGIDMDELATRTKGKGSGLEKDFSLELKRREIHAKFTTYLETKVFSQGYISKSTDILRVVSNFLNTFPEEERRKNVGLLNGYEIPVAEQRKQIPEIVGGNWQIIGGQEALTGTERISATIIAKPENQLGKPVILCYTEYLDRDLKTGEKYISNGSGILFG